MNKVFKQVLGWFIAAIFFFPIYFWITVSIKKDKDIFALPPKLFDFEVLDSQREFDLKDPEEMKKRLDVVNLSLSVD